MRDVKKLISDILSENKLNHNSSDEYHDEPILFTASQMRSYTPTKYREMRKLAEMHDFLSYSNARVFYEQAKFMEDFEDDYEYKRHFDCFYPTYQSLSTQQLRGYFTWRTKVRKGNIEIAPPPFAYIYVYELINGIGAKTPYESMKKILNFTSAYTQLDSSTQLYFNMCIRDFLVYYNLDRKMFSAMSLDNHEKSMITLSEIEKHSNEEVINAISDISSYHIANSPFYKKHTQDVTAVVYGVIESLKEKYDGMNGVINNLIGSVYSSYFTMFGSSVFYEKKRHPDCVYNISSIYRFKCQNGKWTYERLLLDTSKLKKLSAILKNIDCKMRKRYSYNSSLKPADGAFEYNDMIDMVIDKVLAEKHYREKPVIEIDISKLQTIRDVSLVTQKKLIVDDEECDKPNESVEIIIEKSLSKAQAAEISCLNKTQTEFLFCLIDEKDIYTFCRSNGVMMSVLVDEINDALFENFGDTVILYDGDKPYIAEDYIEEVKGMTGYGST